MSTHPAMGPDEPNGPSIRRVWTPARLLVALALVVLAIMATADAWADISRTACLDVNSSHILLVPLVALWLIWVRRFRFRFLRPESCGWGPALVLLGGGAYYFGDAYLVAPLWHGGAVLVMAGAIVAVLGGSTLRAFLPAFAVLLFLVPVPAAISRSIAVPFEKHASLITQWVPELMGFEVSRNGSSLVVNGAMVPVDAFSNGVRLLFAMILVSYAFAFGASLRQYVRLIIAAVSAAAALLCEVMRLVPTAWLWAEGKVDVAIALYDISGWLMLPLTFLILLGVIGAIRAILVTSSSRRTPPQG